MKILRFLSGGIIIFSILFTIFIGAQKISLGHDFGSSEEYKGILTMWQIDTFEGGIGSRKQFLMSKARGFERENQGVLLMVIDHTPESARESMDNGIFPDIISFGCGVEVKEVLKLNGVAETLGGKIGGETYATPWCRGGYTIIGNPKLTDRIGDQLEKVLVSQGEYTQPLTALYFSGISVEELVIKSPMDAYVEFVNGKTKYFLGTQRDINRLERRGVEVISRPLTAFNDLYQYACITSTDKLKRFYSEKFIKYLLSEKVQSTLNEIGMMSAFGQVKYDNEHVIAMQKIKNFKTISAFIDRAKLVDMQKLALKALQGEKDSIIKLKNMLV